MNRRGFLFGALALALSRGAAADEMVAFNVKTLKFHCPSCEWARRCTKSCVLVSHEEAVKRGGVPCKVCGGHCRSKISAVYQQAVPRWPVSGQQPKWLGSDENLVE